MRQHPGAMFLAEALGQLISTSKSARLRDDRGICFSEEPQVV